MRLSAIGERATIWAMILVNLAGCRPEPNETLMHDGGYRPQHLEPVTPGSPMQERYRAIVRDLLIVSPGDCGRVIVRLSSASSEYAVSAYSRDGRWFLTATEATRQIWGSIAGHESEEVTRAIKILRWDKEIDAELAQAIHAVCSARLRDVRPPDNDSRGSDGGLYEFSVEAADGTALVGETWSPDSGPLLRLTTLAMELGNFCADTPRRKNMTRDELLRMCAGLAAEGQR